MVGRVVGVSVYVNVYFRGCFGSGWRVRRGDTRSSGRSGFCFFRMISFFGFLGGMGLLRGVLVISFRGAVLFFLFVLRRFLGFGVVVRFRVAR